METYRIISKDGKQWCQFEEAAGDNVHITFCGACGDTHTSLIPMDTAVEQATHLYSRGYTDTEVLNLNSTL